MIRVLAFDADDTLWENEPLFREAEAAWAGVLRDYGTLESLSAALYAVESSNMAELGYGTKAFIISLLETAIQVSGGNLTAAQTSEIIRIGRRILQNPAVPLPGVEETLSTLHGRFRMVLLTKGDALEQRHKVERSGLARYFDLVDIVPQKTVREYFELCRRLDIGPDELLMVGNSFKSDIAPVLELGGAGIYIPFRVTWEHEKTEEYEHPRLRKAAEFKDIIDILANELP